MKNLKIYTSFISPYTFRTVIEKNLLPIIIIRYINNSQVVGQYSGSAIHFKELAPSTELFRHKRDNLITLDEYKKKYVLEVSKLSLSEILEKFDILKNLSEASGIVLMGYGSNPDNCHRSVLADILNKSELLEDRVEELIL